MPQLPSPRDLGQLPNLSGPRPVGRYDPTPIAAGGEAVARGVEGAGEGAEKLGAKLGRYGVGLSRFEQARAQADFLAGKADLDAEAQADPAYADLPQRYIASLAALRELSAGLISDPEHREAFLVSATPAMAESAEAVHRLAAQKYAQAMVSDAETRLEDLRQKALRSENPAEQARLIDAGSELIHGLREAGYEDPERSDARRKDWVARYAFDRVGAMPPEYQVALLRGMPEGGEEAGNGEEQASGSAPDLSYLVGFIPEEERNALLQWAESSVLNQVSQGGPSS